jgi:hypothetical protein
MLLRPEESAGYSLVGECYVHGLMHGGGAGDTRFKIAGFRYVLRESSKVCLGQCD